MPYLWSSDVVSALGVSLLNSFSNKSFDWTDLITEMVYKVVSRAVDGQLDAMTFPFGMSLGRYGDASPDAVGNRPWEKNVTYEEFLKGKEYYAALGALAAVDQTFRMGASTNSAVAAGFKSGLSSYMADNLFFASNMKNVPLL